jgi:hypothetical protein
VWDESGWGGPGHLCLGSYLHPVGTCTMLSRREATSFRYMEDEE